MKVVFLDFNGVLDTWENMDEVDFNNLKRLKTIVDETNAKVVISSSLKNSYYYTGEFSKHLLDIIKQIQNEGIEVIGITPNASTREEEIEMYLKEHPGVENFCIIDDDYYMEKFKDNMVKLPPQIQVGQRGLEEKYMNIAIKILNKNDKEKCSMMEKNVIKFYALCNRLKDLERTGWKDWNVKRKRLESVAEHVFGVQMLALAMKSEFQYDIDIYKVIFMLAVHELEEIYIGDLTLFEISKEEKEKLGHEAVAKILDGLLDKEQIISLITEFDKRETLDAKFAFWCDKLECDLQSKIYDEECCVDLSNQENNKTFKDNTVQELLKQESSWSNMWLEFGQRRYNYDENFKSVSDYAKKNGVKELIK